MSQTSTQVEQADVGATVEPVSALGRPVQARTQPAGEEAAQPQRTSNLLLVEDDTAQLRTLTAIMRAEEFDVTSCATAADALEQVRQQEFAVAIVDLRLPDLSGTELLQQLKAYSPGTRLVVHTGYGSFDSAKQAVNVGAFAYVEKMNDPGELVRHVQRAFRAYLAGYADNLEAAVAERTAALRQALKEQRTLQEELRQAQKMEAIGQLTDAIAHDFNNLLTVIIGNASLLQQRLSAAQQEFQEPLALIEDAAEHAGSLTRSLLTFSRRVPTLRRPVNLATAVKRSTRMLRSMLPESVKLTVDAPEDDAIWVSADRTQLHQLVFNLTLNGRDALEGKGGCLRICVRPARFEELDEVPESADGWACLSVSDTGNGMLPQVQRQIFEPFFTTKARGRGTGLGLAIVKGIVEGHDGQIKLQSEFGVGTTFEIFLARCAEPEEAAGTPAPAAPGSRASRLAVLAEDNELVRNVAATLLRRQGFTVIPVSDGAAALKAFRTQQDEVGLLVLDVNLPDRTGTECLAELRQQGVTTPAILMTGDATEELDELSDAGTAVLCKPFQEPELAHAISQLLQAEVSESVQT